LHTGPDTVGGSRSLIFSGTSVARTLLEDHRVSIKRSLDRLTTAFKYAPTLPSLYPATCLYLLSRVAELGNSLFEVEEAGDEEEEDGEESTHGSRDNNRTGSRDLLLDELSAYSCMLCGFV